jgi:aryl-alcohol dehydrogenase-like predicted oxidoreductase
MATGAFTEGAYLATGMDDARTDSIRLGVDERVATVRAALRPSAERDVARLVLGGRLGEHPASHSYRLLDHFYSAGGRLVETAAAYVGGQGERVLGRWLARAPTDVVCITKVGHPAEGSYAVDVDRLEREINQSAERLGVGQLDVVLLHRDDPTEHVADMLGPLLMAASDGRVAGVGVANWRAPRLREAARIAAQYNGIVAASAQFSLAVPAYPLWPGTVHADSDLLALHGDLEMPLLAWSANARGWFGGRLLNEPPADHAARRSFLTSENLRRLERCRVLADARQLRPASVALAWTLGTMWLALPVIGPADLSELNDAIAAAKAGLSDKDLAYLSGVL